MNGNNNLNPGVSFLKSIFLFFILFVSIFLISCGGILVGLATFGIGLLITIPGAIWIISKILIHIFGVVYAKKFALEMIAIFFGTALIYLIFVMLVIESNNENYIFIEFIMSLLFLLYFLISSYRLHVIYRASKNLGK